MSNDFAPVFEGWNVWAVWQQKDLDFEPMMVGIDRDRRLRIWVEDAVRLGAPGTMVADPIDLKGGQIEILPSVPSDLQVKARKEDVGGDSAMVIGGPGELRTVRFFNRGAPGKLVWPHDSNYLLDRVLTPSTSSPATSGPAPHTIGGTVGGGLAEVAKPLLTGAAVVVGAGLAIGLGVVLWRARGSG